MLDFIAGRDSHTEQPLTWCDLTETSRRSNWHLTCQGYPNPWSTGITCFPMSIVSISSQKCIWCYTAKCWVSHALLGVTFPVRRAASRPKRSQRPPLSFVLKLWAFAMLLRESRLTRTTFPDHKVLASSLLTGIKKYNNNAYCICFTLNSEH